MAIILTIVGVVLACAAVSIVFTTHKTLKNPDEWKRVFDNLQQNDPTISESEAYKSLSRIYSIAVGILCVGLVCAIIGIILDLLYHLSH